MRVSVWLASISAAMGVAIGCSTAESRTIPKPALLPRAAAQQAALAADAVSESALVNSKAAAVAVPAKPAPEPEPPDPTQLLLALPSSHSTSIGAPTRGRLEGSVMLPDRGPGYYHNPTQPEAARYGALETLQAIVRAAAVVERELPGSALAINDIGLEQGGPIPRHGSHQSGRDADILFYVLDASGAPTPAVGVPLDRKGKGVDFKDLSDPSDDQPVQIDLARSWRFMQALIEQAPDQLQRIFIAEHLRRLLLAEAARAGAPAAAVERFGELSCQPGTPHDDHLHVRFYCTPEDMAAGCQDSLPTYAWRSANLAALGLTPVVASTARTPDERAARASRTVTPAEARRRAGPMHAKVIEFLAEREAWLKQPHPGRPYCK